MVSIERLYAATNDGLSIIELHYPEAGECARHNKPFRFRPGERTPSAHVKLIKGVYRVTDFGDQEKAMDPIEIHMRATGYTFAEAMIDLGQRFNVVDEINRSVNRPDVKKRPAREAEEDGTTTWDIDQEFTARECEIMGPRVQVKHLKALHWYRVTRLTSVKNREATDKRPTENYPILMRECWFTDEKGNRDRFFKIYEPLNAEKAWRFQYQPKGKKPRSYINGLEELAAAFKEFNDAEEKKHNSDPANEGKPYKEKKLPEAIICSGERDALCVRSLGYHPIWFNSETYQVTDEEWKLITRYVETVYNIPDIDTTGRVKGTELALRFIDIHTIWLPESLQRFKDNRGHPRKDFRDWMEIYKENKDFRDLLELATPAKFWTTVRQEKTGRLKYSLDISCLHEFLMLNGFYTLKDATATTTQFIHIVGNIVKLVTAKDIRGFVHNWTIKTARPRELRNLVLSDPKLSQTALEALREIDPDFTNYTENSQFFYFPTFAIEVTGSKLIQHDNRTSKIGRYVWEENVIGHNIKILPDMFDITHEEGNFNSEAFDINITSCTSNYFRYLINSSRIYWRKELEDSLAGLTAEEREKYAKEHKFDIAGPNLSQEEIAEQKRCLINKIFTIGYMMHRYKSPSRPWAPFVMDNIIGENDQCNGGSGKSFMFKALSQFVKFVPITGKNNKVLENEHWSERINKHISIALFDDIDEYFPVKQLYDTITGDMTINPKNNKIFTLMFEEAPKFAFTTNFVPQEFNGSTVRRMLYVVMSDYYHQASSENDYKETRKISDDFGKDLFTRTYTEPEWEADINFILQCVRFYLSVAPHPVKIEPRMDNIIFRKYLRDMSENFKEWAEGYFSIDGGNLDVEIVREKALEDYKRFSQVQKITMQKFSKSLRGFVYTCDYIEEMNPEELHTSGGRILRRIEDPITKQKVQKEIITVR